MIPDSLKEMADDPLGINDDTDTAKRATLGILGATGLAATSGCMTLDAIYQDSVRQRVEDDIEGLDPEETVTYFLNEQRNYEDEEGSSVTFGSFDVEMDVGEDRYDLTITGDTPFDIADNELVAVRDDTGERIALEDIDTAYASVLASVYETVHDVCENEYAVARGQNIDTSATTEALGERDGSYTISLTMGDHALEGTYEDHDTLYEEADNPLFGDRSVFSDRADITEL